MKQRLKEAVYLLLILLLASLLVLGIFLNSGR